MHGPGGHHHDHGHAHGSGGHHGHDHGQGGHHHHVEARSVAEPRWLWVALALNVGMAGVQAIVAVLAGSTALLADSAHVLTDAIAIGVALGSIVFARRPAAGRYTFGLGRVEILGALANGASLLVLAGVLGLGALLRIGDPPPVDGGLVVVGGTVGLVGNLLAAWALAKASRQSLAVEGAFQHTVMDAISSVAAIAAGIAVALGAASVIDPILALLVTGLMLRGGWLVLWAAAKVLLEAAPAGVTPAEVGAALASVDGVVEVHDLHVWEVTQGFPSVTAHVIVGTGVDCHATRLRLQRVLTDQFDLPHATLQVDHDHRDELVQLGQPWGSPDA